MSGRLVSIVFDSALPAWLKPYAAACATFAADDGSKVYPSVARIARMVGKSERSTQRAIHALRDRGVLALEHGPGRYRAARYVFRAIALPHRDEPTQLPLFPQAEVVTIRRNVDDRGKLSTDFHRFPQPWVTPVAAMGDTHVTRSVNDPSRTSTHLDAARALKANARKTGTD
jgi:hypothetical protein